MALGGLARQRPSASRELAFGRRGKLLLAPCPRAVLEPPLGVGPHPPERRADVSCEITGEARRRITLRVGSSLRIFVAPFLRDDDDVAPRYSQHHSQQHSQEEKFCAVS